jgi:hypothetical protein
MQSFKELVLAEVLTRAEDQHRGQELPMSLMLAKIKTLHD